MSFVPQSIIETDRLRLRPFTIDDAAAIYALNSHPEVVRYTGESVFSDLEEATQLIHERILPDYARHGFGRWAMVGKDSGAVIGSAGLKHLDDLGEVDVGYRLLPGYWGRGLATEATCALVDYGFRELHLSRIIGLVDAPNVASIRVLEKSGFAFEKLVEYRSQEVLQFAIKMQFAPQVAYSNREM